MKKLLTFLTLTIFVLTSCSSDGEMGPQGPTGPQGPPGEPGEDGLIGLVFDVPAVDFTEEDEYSVEIEYSEYTSEQVFETDVVLVYMKTGEDGESEGEPVDVWSLLPQVYYIDGGGSMQYNYDYTFFSTLIYLDADVDLSTLDASYTDDQVFRIAIVPAAFASDQSIDITNYQEVMSALDINNREIPEVEIQE